MFRGLEWRHASNRMTSRLISNDTEYGYWKIIFTSLAYRYYILTICIIAWFTVSYGNYYIWMWIFITSDITALLWNIQKKMSGIMQNYITEQDNWTYFVSLQTDSAWQILRYWYPNVSLFVNVMTISACEALLNCHCLEISKPITRNSIQYAVKRLMIKYCNQYNGVIMSALSSHITSLTIVYSNVDSRRRSKKTSKRFVTGLDAGKSPVTGEFPTQRASNAGNVSTWWHYHRENEWLMPRTT